MKKNSKRLLAGNSIPGTNNKAEEKPLRNIPYKKDADSQNTSITENTDARKSKNPDIKNPADEQQFEEEHTSKS